MKNEIEAMITDITATTAEAEDYTGEDGTFILRQVPYAQKKPTLQRERPVSGVTATQQTATASGQPVKSSKPPKADRSTLKKWRT